MGLDKLAPINYENGNMAIITVDFETYYAQDYSLRKMTEVDYILDPRFQTILASVKVDDGPTEVCVGHEAVARKLATFDWSRCAFLAHNSRFDGAILAWHYGIVPALYLDTLGMARALTHCVIGKSSLAAVSKYLGLPPKGDEVVRATGKRLEDFSPAELDAYGAYCKRDTDNTKAAFDLLRPAMPASELYLIDLVLRMFIEPQVQLDPMVLAEHLHAVRVEKAAALAKVAHIDKSVFSSNLQFAALLDSYGVEVPRKISLTTGLETWALAKNDRDFVELCHDETQPIEVQAILAARLGVKSTIEETRTERLLGQAQREWPEARGTAWAAVPLKYAGAHTHRFSGDAKVNWQNFKRGSRIREAVRAPTGWRIVHRDASQIEARMVAWLAGCTTLVRAFAEGRDTYSEFASIIYGRLITKADTKERFCGKVSVLQLTYQSGPDKLRHTLFIGNGGISIKIELPEAQRIVYKYRDTYSEIPALWKQGDMAIELLITRAAPDSAARSISLLADTNQPLPVVEVGHEAIWLPNGLPLAYPKPRRETRTDPVTGQRKYEDGYTGPYGEFRKLYGGKLTENISQALSRIVVTDIAVRMRQLTGYHPFLSTHDSLDYCVPEEVVEWYDEELERQFAVRPSWAKGLPLASEGGWGPTLLAAEKRMNV